MSTCDRCGDELGSPYVTVRNASYDGTVQMLRSRMDVCEGCYDAMQESDSWRL